MADLSAHADTLDHMERAIAQRDAYRLLFRAALDQLTEAHATIANQQRIIQEMREAEARYARGVFGAGLEPGEES